MMPRVAFMRAFLSLSCLASAVIIVYKYSCLQQKTKPLIVFGILSDKTKRELRDAQRTTWLSTAMHEELPFQFTYKFLIDMPTNGTTEEAKLHNDIVYLNVTHHGYVNKFGEKIYLWLKYVVRNYPNAYLGARLDDDVFLCVPEMFERLYKIMSSKLLYGRGNGKVEGRKVNRYRRVDEMFLVIGRELMERISGRKYCDDMTKCNASTQLADWNWGGESVGDWLSIYDDVDFKPDNDRMIWFGRQHMKSTEDRKQYAAYVKANFCDNWLLYHKSTPGVMQTLHSRYTNQSE